MTLESESIKLRENFYLSNVAIEPFLILIRESTKKTTIEMETCSGKQAIQSLFTKKNIPVADFFPSERRFLCLPFKSIRF